MRITTRAKVAVVGVAMVPLVGLGALAAHASSGGNEGANQEQQATGTATLTPEGKKLAEQQGVKEGQFVTNGWTGIQPAH